MKEIQKRPLLEKTENGDELNTEEGGTALGNVETSRVPFLMLGLDLPPPPLFKDAMEKNIIPQVCILYVSVHILLAYTVFNLWHLQNHFGSKSLRLKDFLEPWVPPYGEIDGCHLMVKLMCSIF